MDSEHDGIAWFANVQQKFETLLSEVDNVLTEENLQYVEDQLQTLGASLETHLHTINTNFKQLCSDLVHDVLPLSLPNSNPVEEAAADLSTQHKENADLAAHENLELGLDTDPQDKETLAHPSFSEPRVKKNNGVCMSKQLNVDAKENQIVVISNVGNTAEVDPCMQSPFSDISKANGRRKRSNCQEEETATFVNCVAENSIPSVKHALPVELPECRVSDDGRRSGNPLPALTHTDNCLDKSDPENEVTESENYFSSDSESSLYMDAEEPGDHIVIESDKETSKFSESNLYGSCILVDRNDLPSVGLEVAKHQPFEGKSCEVFSSQVASMKEQKCEQQAAEESKPCAGTDQLEGESSKSDVLLTNKETTDNDFSESDWEII